MTCQAGLAVHNDALLGQIVACPRCGSMVEVSAPVEPAKSQMREQVQPEIVENSRPAEASHGLAPSTDEPTLPDAAQQASAEVAKYQVKVWSMAGLFIGAVFVGAFLLTRENSESSDSTKVATDQLPTATSVSQTPPSPPATTSEPEESPPPPLDAPADPPTALAEKSIDTEPVAEPPTNSPPLTPSPLAPAEELKNVADREPHLTQRIDPLDFNPESLTLDTLDEQASEQKEKAVPSIPQPLENLTISDEEIPSTLPAVRRGPVEDGNAGGRDAAKQLAISVPAVQFQDLPLVDCLRLFTQLSGVPISVAPEQLLMAGITPRVKTSLSARETSVGDMLTQVLKPLRLEYRLSGEQVVVMRQEAAKTREINYPVNDLVNASTSEARLAAWIEQLVAPETWQAAGGEGTLESTSGSLRIEQAQQVQYPILVLLERLRLARKLPPRSRFPVERLAGTPVNYLLSEKLAAATTFTFSQFSSLDDIFAHWQTEMNVPIFVDWPALADEDLWPKSTIACAVQERPWHEALESVLEPLGLGWRAVPGEAIEITSASKVQSELQLEVYPLREDAKVDSETLQSLSQQVTAKSAVILDPSGAALLVLQPAATQRLIAHRLRELGLVRDQ